MDLVCERRSEIERIGQAASSMTGRKKYSSDVNIWLVSDLGRITSGQHCQYLCRMP